MSAQVQVQAQAEAAAEAVPAVAVVAAEAVPAAAAVAAAEAAEALHSEKTNTKRRFSAALYFFSKKGLTFFPFCGNINESLRDKAKPKATRHEGV